MLASVYGFKPDDIKSLTFRQISGYIRQIPYAWQYSDKFGAPPPRRVANHTLVTFAEQCDIIVPPRVKFQMGTEDWNI